MCSIVFDPEINTNTCLHVHKQNTHKHNTPTHMINTHRYYTMRTSRRISFEWALIRGQTDSEDTAHELGRLLKGLLCHVNVIPLNPTGGFGGRPTSKRGVDEFCDILGEYVYICIVCVCICVYSYTPVCLRVCLHVCQWTDHPDDCLILIGLQCKDRTY